ncbi:GNAT family protein [uncultured Williamsia sp.]|uniref:GNAT family N-acetyltransferase n=1 Tax=uncultured Williamsia sp. TaxID=259311 RepID=UPI00262A1339|nr:GNAT family protein [uncultured Williamsia sp.]
MIELRPAVLTDAEAMAEVQNAIHRAGLRSSPVDVDEIRGRYLEHEHSIACTVAVEGQRVVGFQSLKRAWVDNPYDVAVGWGIIGTHIDPDAGRGGIGRRLFVVTRAAAETVGLRHVDATIGVDNRAALAFYAAIGFTPYRERDSAGAVGYRFDVDGPPLV